MYVLRRDAATEIIADVRSSTVMQFSAHIDSHVHTRLHNVHGARPVCTRTKQTTALSDGRHDHPSAYAGIDAEAEFTMHIIYTYVCMRICLIVVFA